MAGAGIYGAGVKEKEHISGIEINEFNKDDLVVHPDYIPRIRGSNLKNIYSTFIFNFPNIQLHLILRRIASV